MSRARRRLAPSPTAAVVALLVALHSPAFAGCTRRAPMEVDVVLTLGGGDRPIHGLDVVVALPPDADVAHDKATGRIAAGSLHLATPAAGSADGKFKPHATAPSARVLVASREPLASGVVLTLRATLRDGGPPNLTRFEVASSRVAGLDGQPVAGASAWVSGVRPR